jgi:hypothetical protein
MEDKEVLKKLISKGNELFLEHKNRYGDLRGFRKSITSLLQNELDGGKEREVNAFEINDYRMPR